MFNSTRSIFGKFLLTFICSVMGWQLENKEIPRILDNKGNEAKG